MDRPEVWQHISPCGLDCGRCLNNPDSPIAQHARALQGVLGNFSRRAASFAAFDPVFSEYATFDRLLTRLGQGGCTGCRSGQGLFASCRVKDCVREHGVDFCAFCSNFAACDPGLPPRLSQRWRDNNHRLREGGVAAYADWLAGQARY